MLNLQKKKKIVLIHTINPYKKNQFLDGVKLEEVITNMSKDY